VENSVPLFVLTKPAINTNVKTARRISATMYALFSLAVSTGRIIGGETESRALRSTRGDDLTQMLTS
jgi:hypothetical protein